MYKKKKILYLVTEDWYFKSHRLDLAIYMVEQGWEVIVVCRVDKDKALLEKIGVKVISLRKWNRGSLNIFKEIQALLEIFYIYFREKPDIVHHISQKPVVYGSIASFCLGLKNTINSINGMGFVFLSASFKAKFLRFFILLFYRFFLNVHGFKFVLQNEDDISIFKDLKNGNQNKVFLIRGAGVNVKDFTTAEEPDTVPTITIVARMLKTKGIIEAVEAIKILKDKGCLCKLVLVGSPDPHNPDSLTIEQLKSWSLGEFIDWQGYREDIEQVWLNSHIALLPSYREGTPKSLLEAAAMEKPLITTDVPGCRQLVKHNVTGLIVPKGSVKSLAEAIQVLVECKHKRLQMGQAARKDVVERFSNEVVLRKTMELYKAVL